MESIVNFNLEYSPSNANNSWRYVKVIKRNNLLPPSLYHDINIKYPTNWITPEQKQSISNELEEETIEWFKKLGLLSNEMFQFIKNAGTSNVARYCVPKGRIEHAWIFAKFTIFWTLWDDFVVENPENKERVKKFMEFVIIDDPLITCDPWSLGFIQLGAELKRLGASDNLWKRFVDELNLWTLEAVKEAKISLIEKDNNNNNNTYSFQEILQWTVDTVAIFPISIIMESISGIELPEEIRESEKYKRMLYLNGVDWRVVNDLVSVGKDIDGDKKLNLILVYKNLFPSSSLLDSYLAINSLREMAVKEFDKLAEEILETIEEERKENVMKLFDTMRYIASGYALCQVEAMRYQQFVTSENNHDFLCRVTNLL